jgi:hypothetical protein
MTYVNQVIKLTEASEKFISVKKLTYCVESDTVCEWVGGYEW